MSYNPNPEHSQGTRLSLSQLASEQSNGYFRGTQQPDTQQGSFDSSKYWADVMNGSCPPQPPSRHLNHTLSGSRTITYPGGQVDTSGAPLSHGPDGGSLMSAQPELDGSSEQNVDPSAQSAQSAQSAGQHNARAPRASGTSRGRPQFVPLEPEAYYDPTHHQSHGMYEELYGVDFTWNEEGSTKKAEDKELAVQKWFEELNRSRKAGPNRQVDSGKAGAIGRSYHERQF